MTAHVTTNVLHVLAAPTEGADEELQRWYDAVHIPELCAAYPEITKVDRLRIAPTPQGYTSLATYWTTADPADLWHRMSTDRTVSRSESMDRSRVVPLLPAVTSAQVSR